MIDLKFIIFLYNSDNIKAAFPGYIIPFDVILCKMDERSLFFPGNSRSRVYKKIRGACLYFGEDNEIPVFGNYINFILA